MEHYMMVDEVDILTDGDLLLMLPGCQEKYQHSIPVRKRIKEPRLNLTFRVLCNDI